MSSPDRRAAAVPLSAILIAVAINFLWGGNPVAVKFSLEVFPPLWTAFFRFSIGILCVATWAYLSRRRIWPQAHEWRFLWIIALLFAIQIATMNIGFSLSTGAMGAVLIATNPLFAALFAHVMLKGDAMTWRKAAGLTIAFCGAALVLLRGQAVDAAGLGALGSWVVLFSACLLGGRLIFSARALQQVDEVRVVIWQMVLSLPLFALGGWWWEHIQWSNLGPAPVLGLMYQGAVVAGLGFSVSFWLMKRYPPSVVLSFNFVSPIAGVLLSVWLLAETVTASLGAGMALVAVGLYLIARR